MLMYTSNDSNLDLLAQMATINPVSTINQEQAAANSDTFSKHEVQAQRLRRQRRSNRALSRSVAGWKVRAW